MDTFVNVIIASATIVAIMGLIVGTTIKINTLMSGTIMNFLLNIKLLFKIALITTVLSSIFFGMFSTSPWVDLFGFVYFIGFIFLAVKYTPDIVLHLKNIHQSNLDDFKKQEIQAEFLENYLEQEDKEAN